MKLLLLALALFAGAALAQPVLHIEAPKGFTGSLGRDPAAHVSGAGDAILNIYPFKPLGGAFQEKFRATLLRELVQEDRQERKLAGAPEIAAIAVPGADEALFAKFVEDRAGTLRYRLRVAIRSGSAVALVDYDANGAKAYMGNWPTVASSLETMKVGTAKAAAPAPKPAAAQKGGGGGDGLFLAQTRRFVMRIGGTPGSGDWEITTRFYLLSKDGRFHRGYGLPSVPGGDIRTFDFAQAERQDAGNTGSFIRTGSKLVFRSAAGETVEGSLADNQLAVENLTFKKSALKP